MNEKFMKIIKIAVPTLTLIIIASQLFGAPATTQDETLQMIQRNEMIEIEIAVPKDQEQGTTCTLNWIELAMLNTYADTLRNPIDSTLGIEFNYDNFIKTGMLYESNEGFLLQNNTLKGALQNKEFRAAVDNEDTISAFSDAACNTFCDLESDEEMTNFYMAINAYFDLLPATEEGYSNPQNVLTRAQFMSLVMRAETPVETHWLKVDDVFATVVGESEYNGYAQHLADYSYLTLADKSLNNQTYNGNISRAEAIYMLMNKYYADELKSVDTSKADLDDTKDGGDIAKDQGYTKDYGKSYEIIYMINNPSAGVPTDIYKALVLAEQKGFIDSETRYDEAITLEESVELLVNIYKTLPIETMTSGDKLVDGEIQEDVTVGTNDLGELSQFIPEGATTEPDADGKSWVVTLENGIQYFMYSDGSVKMNVAQWQTEQKIDPDGKWVEHIDLDGFGPGISYDEYKEKQDNGTLTWEDMANLSDGQMSKEEAERRGADGFLYGDKKQREDGSYYIELDDGTILESGDELPDGGRWGDNSQW